MSLTGLKLELAGRAWRLRYAGIFITALALRALFLAQWFGLPYISSLCADSWAYDKWALEILGGGLIRHAAFYQSPFYPYFLAGMYKLFGHSQLPVLWLQAFADSVTCLLVMRIGERCFGGRAGFWAGLLCAFYRPFLFSVAVPGKETFAVFSAALFTLLALRAGGSGRGRHYFFCGLAGGWAALLRSNVLLLLPVVLIWAWQRTPARFLRQAVLPLLLGGALPLVPAALHNWLASRDLVLLNYNGGFTFYLGNNPVAGGAGIYPAGFNSNPLLEESQPALAAEKAAGRALKPSEISSFWLKRGLDFISGNPAAWVKLTAAKFFLFWNRYEIPDNYDLQFVSANFGTVLGWPLVSFALVGCLGAAGLLLCRRKEPSGLILFLFAAYLLSLLPFWMTDRYRLPALVLLLPAAGGVLARSSRLLAEKDLRRALRPFLWASPLILICLLPSPFNLKLAEGAGWAQLITVYAEAGDGVKAVAALEKAAAADRAVLNPELISAAAGFLEKRGRDEEAAALRERSSALLFKR